MREAHDRHNPDAKIGFVIYYPFQFYVYKNVYEKLADKAEFIIDLGPFYPTPQAPDVLPAILALLEKHGASYRVLSDDYYVSWRSVERFLERYDTLVSVWSRGCVLAPENTKRRMVHMTYGAGKELTTFDLVKSRFDLILAYGEFDQAFYSQISHSVIVGNPKFDDWFRGVMDDTNIASVRERLDTQKKTVLYLPTHSDLSSVDQLAPQLRSLGETYNVIVKLHYYIAREEPARLDALTGSGAIVCGDDIDVLPLLRVADVVVSDNSSAIFDAMLADKRLIVTDFLDQEYLDAEHHKLREHRRGEAGALTYSGSIEQRIKQDGTVMTINDATDLAPAVARILKDDDTREKRRALAKQLFSYRDGHSGDRAAAAIEEARATGVRAKPFLYHALVHYTSRTLRRPFLLSTQGELPREEISEVRARSVIVFHESSTPDLALQRSIRALMEQEGNIERDIYILTNDSDVLQKAGVPAHSSDGQDSACRVHAHVIRHSETLGVSLQRLIGSIKHEIVYFTTTRCTVLPHWMLALEHGFKTHPHIGGAGGFIRARIKVLSAVEQFLTHERHRLLGIYGERDPFVSSVMLVTQIFNQTPAGDIRSVAYRRSFLNSIPEWIRTAFQLEAHLKIVALSEKPLYFAVVPSFLFEPRTLHDAMHEVYARAHAIGMAGDIIRLRWVYRAVSLFSVARVAVQYLFSGQVRLAAVALCVGVAGWQGSAQSRFGRIRRRLQLYQRSL